MLQINFVDITWEHLINYRFVILNASEELFFTSLKKRLRSMKFSAYAPLVSG
jgi:hypothetical protein